MNPIKVQVIDDSALIRKLIGEMIDGVKDIEVCNSSPNPIIGKKRMDREWPDVLVLDMEMPQMDGLTFLKQIMSEKPMPIVVFSSLTESGAQITLDAINSGAFGVVEKPKLKMGQSLSDCAEDLLEAIRAAARADMKVVKNNSRKLTQTEAPRVERAPTPTIRPKAVDSGVSKQANAGSQLSSKVVAIGTSTGGTQALEIIIRQLPVNIPGILIVQHMPEKFTEAFAQRLNEISQVNVREAKSGDLVEPGVVLIAPGGRHMIARSSDGEARVIIKDGPPINRHKPSVDVLFNSVADLVGFDRAGFILTGMGGDGAKGLKAMRDRGSLTYAQNQESCVVFGMPAMAIEMDAADHVVGLNSVAEEIMKFSQRAANPRRAH